MKCIVSQGDWVAIVYHWLFLFNALKLMRASVHPCPFAIFDRKCPPVKCVDCLVSGFTLSHEICCFVVVLISCLNISSPNSYWIIGGANGFFRVFWLWFLFRSFVHYFGLSVWIVASKIQFYAIAVRNIGIWPNWFHLLWISSNCNVHTLRHLNEHMLNHNKQMDRVHRPTRSARCSLSLFYLCMPHLNCERLSGLLL